MRYQLCREFEELYAEYQNADALIERQIRLKLNEICMYYGECSLQEKRFVDEIVKKFCELIELIKENVAESAPELGTPSALNNNFLSLSQSDDHREGSGYEDSQELLDEFYEYFLLHHKESTVKDYAARIKTFSARYLQTVPRVWTLYREECQNGKNDPILFTYRHLELIIASFDTKNENGETDKQKNNLRSALRKLNEFKRMKELQR